MLEPAKTVSLLQKQAAPKTFSTEQVIFKEGDSGDFMYGILEGEVDLLVNGKVVETIATGEVFGAGALVGVGTRTYKRSLKRTVNWHFWIGNGFSSPCKKPPCLRSR